MFNRKIAIVHYSAPPVVGGVEGVMSAHCTEFVHAGFEPVVVAGRGEQAALPMGTQFIQIPEMDSQHPAILNISQALENGTVPDALELLTQALQDTLRAALANSAYLIVHNVLFKHFNLPLTAALFRLMDEDLRTEGGRPRKWIAWGHDFTWTSQNSRAKVHPGYPGISLKQTGKT